MNPIFFAEKTNLDAIAAFNEEVEQTKSILISKLYAKHKSDFLSIENLIYNISTKLSIFASEFRTITERNQVGELECNAFEFCLCGLASLQMTLEKIEQILAAHSVDIKFTQFKNSISDLLSHEAYCKQIRETSLKKTFGLNLEIENPKNSFSPINDICSNKSLNNTNRQFTEMEKECLKESLQIESILYQEYSVQGSQGQRNIRMQRYLNSLTAYFETKATDIRGIISELSHFINNAQNNADSIKYYLAVYHQVCLLKHMTPSNLKTLYDMLNFLITKNKNNHLSPYLNLRKAEIIEMHLKFIVHQSHHSDEINSIFWPISDEDEKYIDQQRALLLSITLNGNIEDIELLIKSHYMLCTSCIFANSPDRKNFFIAKKSLEYILKNSPEKALIRAVAHRHLSLLYIFGKGKRFEIDFEKAILHIEELLQFPIDQKQKNIFNNLRTLCLQNKNFKKSGQDLPNIAYYSREILLDSLLVLLNANEVEFCNFFTRFTHQKYRTKTVPMIEIPPLQNFTENILNEIIKTELSLSNTCDNNYDLFVTKIFDYFSMYHNKSLVLMENHLSNSTRSYRAVAKSHSDFLNDCNIPQQLKNESILFQKSISLCVSGIKFLPISDYMTNYFGSKLNEESHTFQFTGMQKHWSVKIPAVNFSNAFLHNVLELDFGVKGINNAQLREENKKHILRYIDSLISRDTLEQLKLNKKNDQEKLINVTHLTRIAHQFSKQYSLDSTHLFNLLCCYTKIEIFVPAKIKKKFMIEKAKLELDLFNSMWPNTNWEDVSSASKNLVFLFRSLHSFNTAIDLASTKAEKTCLAHTAIQKINMPEELFNNIRKLITTAPLIFAKECQISETPQDNFIGIFFLLEKFLCMMVDYSKAQGDEQRITSTYNFTAGLNDVKCKVSFEDQSQYIRFGEFSTLTKSKTLKDSAPELHFQIIPKDEISQSLFIEKLLFAPVNNLYYKKTSIREIQIDASETSDDIIIGSQPNGISTRQESRERALEIEQKWLRKSTLKSQKMRSDPPADSTPDSTAVAVACDLPTLEISNCAMETFKKIFHPTNPMLDLEEMTVFDACDFRTDAKIKHQDVANLILELGGEYISEAGKGSHTKCTLPSIYNTGLLTLMGENLYLDNLEQDEDPSLKSTNAPTSQMVVLTKAPYLKPYSIRQLCEKLITLQFTPRNVKCKK